MAPVIPALDSYKDLPKYGGPTVEAAKLALAQANGDMFGVFDSRAFANYELARFYYSFGYFMWVVLFVITFFKTTTQHNSDDRGRHSIWIWIAAPALIAMVGFNLCMARGAVFGNMNSMEIGTCTDILSMHFWIAVIIFLGLAWATLPYINFFGRDKYGMGYWYLPSPSDRLFRHGCAILT